MSKLAKKNSISLEINNLDNIWGLYQESIKIIRQVIETEQKSKGNQKENFSYPAFFNLEKPKKMLEKILDQ